MFHSLKTLRNRVIFSICRFFYERIKYNNNHLCQSFKLLNFDKDFKRDPKILILIVGILTEIFTHCITIRFIKSERSISPQLLNVFLMSLNISSQQIKDLALFIKIKTKS